MKRDRVRIAAQKRGRLKEGSVAYLKSLGLDIPSANAQTIIVRCANAPVEILYVRHSDIPQYVQMGAADFGIVGGNELCESGVGVGVARDLDFGDCSLVIAAPRDAAIKTLADLEGERIATSYPNCLRAFLKQRDLNLSIITIRGSVEAAPALGLADAVCDLTATGRTLAENNLATLAVLREFRATLIESPIASERKRRFVNDILRAGAAR